VTAYPRTLVALFSLAFLGLAGCGPSATARFYTLNSTATAQGAPATSYAVSVGPVSVPGYVDRPQFVVQAAPNRVALDEFNRWAAPLDEGIARVVAGDLTVLLGTTQVITFPLPPGFTPAYQVTIDVQRFESTPGKGVVVDAIWVVRRSAGGEPRMGRTVASDTVEGEGFDALAAAHSRALAKVSGDIATAIRAAAAEKPEIRIPSEPAGSQKQRGRTRSTGEGTNE
jgi:uncharacterized lipoprotein YmbA